MFPCVDQLHHRGSCRLRLLSLAIQKQPNPPPDSQCRTSPHRFFCCRSVCDTRLCHTRRMSRAQWRPCLRGGSNHRTALRVTGLNTPPEGRKRVGRGHGGGKTWGGEGLVYLASWLQIFILRRPLVCRWTGTDRSSQSEDAWAGHSYFCTAPRRSMLPIPSTPSRARLPDTRTGRWVGATTAVEDTGRHGAHPRNTQQIRGRERGAGEGSWLGPRRPSGTDARHLRRGGGC